MFGARGSSDESGGNSTYRVTFKDVVCKTTKYLGKVTPYWVYIFNVRHKGKLLGTVELPSNKGELLQKILLINNDPFKMETVNGITRKDTTGRVPLKVVFLYQKGGWHIHITTPLDCLPKTERFTEVRGAIGVDTNHGHFDSMEVAKNGETFTLGEYHKNRYDKDAPRNEKKHNISAHIRRLVYRAHELGYAIVLENLDWEGGQKQRGSKLGATLSAMPYRTILFKFMRECARLGVPFRLVNAKYTSLLGNLLATKDHRLSRDVAAAGIIAMVGLSPRLLDTHLKEIVGSAKTLRIIVKNKYSRHVIVLELNLDQMETRGHSDTVNQPEKVGSYRGRLGGAIKQIEKSIGRSRSPGMITCYPAPPKGKRKNRPCNSPTDIGKPNPFKSTRPLEKSLLQSLSPRFAQGAQV